MDQKFIRNVEWEVEGINGWEDFKGIREINGNFSIYCIYLNDGSWIKCTGEHILYTEENEEIQAKDVKIGMKILTSGGFYYVSNIIPSFSAVVYDFIDTDTNTILTNNVVSHNCDELANIDNKRCVDGSQTVIVEHDGKLKEVSVEDLYNAFEMTEYTKHCLS